mgnify:FL=1
MFRTKRFEEAARCYVQAIQLDRRHVAAYQGLADTLLELNRIDQAQKVRQFANDLVSINDFTQQISYQYGDPKLHEKIAEKFDALGDEVSAFGWRATAVALGVTPMTDALKEKQLLLKRGQSSSPKVLDGLQWETWTLPVELPTIDPSVEPQNPLQGPSNIALEDVAQNLGVTSAYKNGAKPNRSWYTVEGSGGGVTVINYDKDGWPDLFFSEAGGSPLDSTPYQSKTFFRSIGGKRFQESARSAEVADIGFGQGVGTADIDQDGFPDLLVANLGVSRIFRNMGDGTFEYQVIPQDDPESVWNSSIHAADVNGDGLPDLLDASYIYGTEAITHKCEAPNSTRISCKIGRAHV